MASPTPKFNQAIKELSERIGDKTLTVDGLGNYTFTSDNLLNEAEYTNFINRAQFALFNAYWEKFEGDKDKFLQVFPELSSEPVQISITSGEYTIANPLLDMFEVYGAFRTTDSKFIRVYPASTYPLIATGIHPDYAATTDNPAIMKIGNKLYYFPQTNITAKISYIRFPVNPITGENLTLGGNNDIPFSNQWLSKIAEIAEEIYLRSIQEK